MGVHFYLLEIKHEISWVNLFAEIINWHFCTPYVA
jgi:hypothetical protein